jgi:hypothetical protein
MICALIMRCHTEMFRGPGSSVGIATGYGLDGPGIEINKKIKLKN